MDIFTENQRKRIARNIRKELDIKFPDYGRNQRLVSLLGVSQETVLNWVTGTKAPGLEHLFRMAVAFDVPIHRLCGYSGKRPVRTKSTAFNNIMNLSIELEQAGNGADEATQATMENVGRILAELLSAR